MFKNVEELKDFLAWCKEEQIQEVKVGECHIVFSALAFIPESYGIEYAAKPQTEERNTSQSLIDADQSTDNDDDLLFHSAQ